MPSFSDEMFGGCDDPKKIEVEISKEVKRIVGERLFEGAVAEGTLVAICREHAALVRSSREHCEGHKEQENRLEDEISRVLADKEVGSRRLARLDALLIEIAAAVGSGRQLSKGEVEVGKRNALNYEYNKRPYLPKPAPSAGAKVDDKAAGAGASSTSDTDKQA